MILQFQIAALGAGLITFGEPNVIVEDPSFTLSPKVQAVLKNEARNAAHRIYKLLGFSETPVVRIRLNPVARVPFTDDRAPDGSVTIHIPSMRLKSDDIRGSRIALYHEMTHAMATGGDHGDRLLTEGLGVYVEDRLGAPNYPDFEQSPDETVRELEAKLGTSVPLAESELARQRRLNGDERRLAYAQEGSFVSWLISKYGLRRFISFYRSDRNYQVEFGKPLTTLETEWRRALAQLATSEP